MELLERELPEGQQSWQSRLGEIRDMTERTIVEIRRLIAALSPAVLEQLGLAAAVRQLATRFRQRYPCRVNLRLRRLERLPRQMEVVLYRLVQECLNNVAKHSECKTVNISFDLTDGTVRLSVQDDGVGFRVDDALNKPGSFGLAGLRERVALLGGQCEIDSRPLGPAESCVRIAAGRCSKRAGTTIRIELPLPSERGLNGQPQVDGGTDSRRILGRRTRKQGGLPMELEPLPA
jgi:signal transduction histidine kinase